ncbi:MAG TPA: hypothetical protein VGO43_10040 [Pyrinomonadaceae bacterium]|nr:hypothetical protein [Pyrinomonadaceae bacterium]
MYRRPKFLDVLLDIRSAMSLEAGNDIVAFVEMIRTGSPISVHHRTVTRVDGAVIDEVQSEAVSETVKSDVVKD